MRSTRAGTVATEPHTINRNRRVVAAGAAAALLGAGVTPALASEAVVDLGRNITVFHNVDIVAGSGWAEGTPLTIRVLRNDVVIGTASGPAVLLPDGVFGLEVNHEASQNPPGPGECWNDWTPDVQPGDRIEVTDGTSTDSVIVDPLRFTDTAAQPQPNGDITVSGTAFLADGTAIPAADLADAGSFVESAQFRGAPDRVEATPGVPGGFTMVWTSPYLDTMQNRANYTEAQARDALLNGTGYGLAFAPTEEDVQILEGLDDVPSTRGLGCEGVPPAADGVTSVTPNVINAATVAAGGPANLQIAGQSFNATAVQARVTDSAATPATVVADAAMSTTGANTPQTWTAAIPMSQIAPLAEGPLTVAMAKNGSATAEPRTLTITKDTVAPAAPTATPAPRAEGFRGPQAVTLSGQAADTIRYTVDGSEPSATVGTVYTEQIQVTEAQTIKAVAVDAAGNASPVASFAYTFAPGVSSTETGATGEVDPGGTIFSLGTTASPSNALVTSLTSPQGGAVTIAERNRSSGDGPAGYSLLGQEVAITAPNASAASPLRIGFRIDRSLLPAGEDGRAVSVQRNGTSVPACTSSDGSAAPDPCVASRTVEGDDTVITVLTSAASTWTFATPAFASIGAACTGVSGESFTDIGGNLHGPAIGCLSGLKITGGTGGGKYDPRGNVTRAQMATFVHRLMTNAGYALPAGDPNRFTDDQGLHETTISSLAQAGVINGLTAQAYGPNQPVSRAQMAALLDRAYRQLGGLRTSSSSDAFGDDNDSVHQPSINNLAALGVTTGTGGGQYSPNGDVKRDQMASFLTRLASRLKAEGTTR